MRLEHSTYAKNKKMSMFQSLIICKCQVYNRIDSDKLDRLIATAKESGIQCRVVDDLCYEVVRHPEKLNDVDAIAGCHCRTLNALALYSGSENIPEVFEINKSLDKILELLKSVPADSNKNTEYDKIHDDWVAWYPVIDSSRCIQCKKCADFCMFGTYAVEAGKVKVVQPSSCKTNCPACARMCPENAIIFPKSEEPNINGSLTEKIKPDVEQGTSFKARLQKRKAMRLFKEDES